MVFHENLSDSITIIIIIIWLFREFIIIYPDHNSYSLRVFHISVS